jgi:hypothetical protein
MRILRFEPKEDITTWELAQIFKLDTMMSSEIKMEKRLYLPWQKVALPSLVYFDSLPENVKRHLVVREE